MRNAKFRREPASLRKDALIRATLSLIAEKGVSAATVRAIAEHAKVTQGLIRHYFLTKEDLIIAAYERHMSDLTEATHEPLLLAADAPPRVRLSVFVSNGLRPPVIDPRSVALWAGFLSRVRSDERMRAAHQRTYLDFRDRLERLIGEALENEGRPVSTAEKRRLAIACNAVIDGLWLEGGALPGSFDSDELEQIGLRSVGAIIGLDLAKHAENS